MKIIACSANIVANPHDTCEFRVNQHSFEVQLDDMSTHL
tara:strand:- start:316 stop:432 length:117 start_codon:yes stop_codon:yes gene_type:complete